ncbi:MAG: TIGR00282 family metallophosphoesterase [Alkalispirochaeta sp.]|jgi:calcineurin-like phosphoesterase
MRILYIAEIVGKSGVYCVKTLLPQIRREKNIDFVIAAGDGATGGFGIGKNHSVYLKKLGVDVITGGDQTFFKKDIAEHIDKAYYMLRPANLPPEMPGRGWRHYNVAPVAPVAPDVPVPPVATPTAGNDATGEVAAGTVGDDTSPEATGSPPLPAFKIAVVNLIGQSGYSRIHGGNPFTYLENVLERITKDSTAVLVDFHALTTAEKYTMFHYLNGKVTAVIGSGQRVQTADAHVMSSGTAVICDAGRTGSQNSVSGLVPDPEIKKYLTKIPIRSEEAWESLELQGVLIDIDPVSGYVTSFEAVRESCPEPPSGADKDSGGKGRRKSGGPSR